jgi:hypothetical protein
VSLFKGVLKAHLRKKTPPSASGLKLSQVTRSQEMRPAIRHLSAIAAISTSSAITSSSPAAPAASPLCHPLIDAGATLTPQPSEWHNGKASFILSSYSMSFASKALTHFVFHQQHHPSKSATSMKHHPLNFVPNPNQMQQRRKPTKYLA